jgi:SAM-dependent methyltransferase
MTSNNSGYPGKELESMSFAFNYHKWIVEKLVPYLGQNVVEVGAGVGDLTDILLQTELEHLYAFEPAANLFPLLNQKMKGQVRVSAVNEYFRPELVPSVIDSVLYINVLEHIENDSKELSTAYRALRSGGYLLVFVPALQWLFSEADSNIGHFRRYYKKDLVRLVENAGFSVEKAHYFDLAGILPWYVHFVLLKNSFSKSSVALYDKLVVPTMRVFENMIKPPIGKNILIVARKA